MSLLLLSLSLLLLILKGAYVGWITGAGDGATLGLLSRP